MSSRTALVRQFAVPPGALLTFIVACSPVSAQTPGAQISDAESSVPQAAAVSDPIEPFLGTWSGVFTTQRDEFWEAEDFVCFPGCAPATREYMTALLDDPANDELPFGVLMGQALSYETEQLTAKLTPLGRSIQAANEPENDPKLHCQPYGLVRQVTNPLPFRLRRLGEHLLFEYEEWSLLRTVYLDGRPHPEFRTPSLLGHSVGHVENGVLIIETAGVVPDRISDATQVGYTDQMTAVERYTIEENPRRLVLELTIEDPLVLTAPHVVTKTWLYTPDLELVRDSCGELPGVF